MATDKQIAYVESLMAEHGLTRDDLAKEDEGWWRYEKLRGDGVNALLRWIRGDEATPGSVSDRYVWRAISALIDSRRAERDRAYGAALARDRLAEQLVGVIRYCEQKLDDDDWERDIKPWISDLSPQTRSLLQEAEKRLDDKRNEAATA